jgi:hypothetical protein
MRRIPLNVVPLILFFLGSMACKQEDNALFGATDTQPTGTPMTNPLVGGTLQIRIGPQTFRVTLLDNPTVTAFKARLPMTVSMIELNGNEKYVNLSNDLPANATNPGTIQTGDLMLYGSNTLVLFYESFPTSYKYTKLGRIDNPADLAAALGSGNTTVTFALE